MNTFLIEAKNEYEKALHLGKKRKGSLEILDQILEEKNISVPKEVSLGTVQIPVDQIVGTKTDGRSNAFNKDFYPLLPPDSEFGQKWISLCASHLEEGIRDSIKAYEFMNKFYILEGNKRVSVLKYFGAPTITGQVIRIIPPYSEEKEIQIYYEFMDFYKYSRINYVTLTKTGSYKKLIQLTGKEEGTIWTLEDRELFRKIYLRFHDCYRKLDIQKTTTGDAFLYFLNLYPYDALKKMDYVTVGTNVEKLQDEFKLLSSEQATKLHMDPTDTPKKSLLRQLLPTGMAHLKVAFIHEQSAETFGWTYGHELGRTALEQHFAGQITTTYYDKVTAETAEEVIEQAIQDQHTLIFTTSPIFSMASLKAAITHPDVKILNCSLNNSHKAIRTYFLRMYEIKFLMGVIAGSLTENDRIGYLVKYPTATTSRINAFALGAKTVNPQAKVYLLDEQSNIEEKSFFQEQDISIICGKDMSPMGVFDQRFGLYHTQADSIWNMAMPVWDWGKFYEKIIQNIADGNWKRDDISDENQGLNYWWGTSSGVLDIICSGLLPVQTRKLVDFFKQSIANGSFSPFSGILISQNGVVQPNPDYTLSPEEIISMDWLADNIIGTIPKSME